MIVVKKNKWLLAQILTISFLMVSFSALAAVGPNLVFNSDFETDDNADGIPDGWNVQTTGGSTIKLDTQYKTSGSNSVLINKVNDGKSATCAIYQDIEVQGLATYELNVNVKLERSEGAKDYFSIGGYIYDSSSGWLGARTLIKPVESDGFENYTATIVMPEGAKRFMLRAEVYTDSPSVVYAVKAWVDDLTLCRVDDLPPVPPQDIVSKRLENGQISLTWREKKAADGDLPVRIEVYRSLEEVFQLDESTLVADKVRGTSWIDQSIKKEDRRRYYYKFKAFDEAGNHSISELVIVKGLASLSGVVSTSDGTSPVGAELKLQYNGTSISTVLGNDGNFSFPSLAEGNYTLILHKSGFRLLTKTVDIQPEEEVVLDNLHLIFDPDPPNPPQNILADTPSPGLVKLSWDPPAPSELDGDIAEYYQIYRSEGESSSFVSAQLIVPRIEDTSYLDISVQAGKTYIYYVISFDLADNPSEEAIASNPVTPIIPPSASLISPSAGAVFVDEKPEFIWENLDNVNSYTLELSKDKTFTDGKALTFANIEENKLEITQLLSDATWYWRVKAHFNTGVVGDYSEPESFVLINRNPQLGGAGMIKVQPQVFAPRNAEESYVSYILDTPSEVSLKVYSTGGQCVRTIFHSMPQDTEPKEFSWDGKDNSGQFVPNGLYFFELNTKADGLKPIRLVGRVLVFN